MGIMGNISVAKRLVASPDQVTMRLAEAEKACQRATTLTSQLLTFARGGAPLRQTINLVKVLAETAAFAICGSTIRIESRIPENLWPVEADAGQLSQMIHSVATS